MRGDKERVEGLMDGHVAGQFANPPAVEQRLAARIQEVERAPCNTDPGVAVGETTLADQTISFMQQLTEAVQQVPGSVVVATLPASKEEVASSEKGQEAFITLEKRFQRLGADLKPVADDEIYAVVRTRALCVGVAALRRSSQPCG